MKVRDFIKEDVDLDVYNDVTDDWGIAFVGPIKLTEEGEREFAEVLDYDVEINEGVIYPTATIVVGNLECDDDEWEDKLFKAEQFFEAAAGVCNYKDYEKWFVE